MGNEPNEMPDIDLDKLLGATQGLSYDEIVERFQIKDPQFLRFTPNTPQMKKRIPSEPKPEPEMSLVKIRIQHGSKQPNNMAEWNEKEGILDLYYLNGFEPEIVNMKSKRIDDNTIQISLETALLEHLKSKRGVFHLRGLGPASAPLIGLSGLTYRKHTIGHHICKHYIPAIEGEFQNDIASVKEDGILPADYEYGNVPFGNGMCTHPIRTKREQAEVVECDSVANMALCRVFEKEEGVSVEIKTKTRGTLEGIKVRTFNPYRGTVYVEMFDKFGDRFSEDTEHNILPDKDNTDDHEAEEKQSPLLKGRAASSA